MTKQVDWADTAWNEGEGLSFEESQDMLPMRQETRDPETGITTVVEWRRDDRGRKVRVTRKLRTIRMKKRISKEAIRRQKLAKFGMCEGKAQGPEDGITYLSYEVIPFEFENDDQEEDESFADQLSGKTSIVVCRHCGAVGDHWTLKCPKRGGVSAQAAEAKKKAAEDVLTGTAEPDTTGGYIPPHLRAGARGVSMSSEIDDLPVIKVSPLSPETTERDLHELFGRFGIIKSIRMPRNRQNERRGFAFLTFLRKEDADQAFKRLDGYGYDNLILRLEWSKSMAQRQREQGITPTQDRAPDPDAPVDSRFPNARRGRGLRTVGDV